MQITTQEVTSGPWTLEKSTLFGVKKWRITTQERGLPIALSLAKDTYMDGQCTRYNVLVHLEAETLSPTQARGTAAIMAQAATAATAFQAHLDTIRH